MLPEHIVEVELGATAKTTTSMFPDSPIHNSIDALATTLRENAITCNDVEPLKRGYHSDVYRGTLNGRPVALKQFRFKPLTDLEKIQKVPHLCTVLVKPVNRICEEPVP